METLTPAVYEIKTARSGKIIPVINGVHLHSSYNPIKEAQVFIERHAPALKVKNEVLVLGLGFAYHINEIVKVLLENHGDNFKVVVIEPSEDIYLRCIHEELLECKNVTVYTGTVASNYYTNRELTSFLLRRPMVIAHPASFNLYQNFFKSFLSYEAPKYLSQLIEQTNIIEIKEYLAQFSNTHTLDQVAELAFNQNSKLKELDFLLLAMREMTAKISKDESGQGDQ